MMSMIDQKLLQMQLEAMQAMRMLMLEKDFLVMYNRRLVGWDVVFFILAGTYSSLYLFCLREKKIMALMSSITT